jgi:hypothetical protein
MSRQRSSGRAASTNDAETWGIKRLSALTNRIPPSTSGPRSLIRYQESASSEAIAIAARGRLLPSNPSRDLSRNRLKRRPQPVDLKYRDCFHQK